MNSQDDQHNPANNHQQTTETAKDQIAQVPENCADLSSEEMRKTIHKLRLKQIELERKVEALRAGQTQVKYEKSLREKRDFSECMFENAQAIILVLDTKGCIVHFNLFMEQLIGYKLFEVRGLDWFETFVKLEEDKTFRYIFSKVVDDIQTNKTVIPIITKDGASVLVEWSSKTLKDENGSTVGILATGQDITEQKKLELQLVRDNILLKSQQEASPDGILIVDENDNIISFNRRFCKIWEIPDHIMAEQSSEKVMQYVLPRLVNPDEFVIGIQDLCKDKKSSSFDEIILTNGTIFGCHSSPMVGPDDQYYGRVWFYRDITERKQSEQQIAELNRDFIAFLEGTTDFIYFKDNKSRYRFCSQTLANITGHSHWREMVGKNDLEVFPEKVAQIYFEENLSVLREGLPLLNKIDPFVDATGNKGWVSTSKWPLLDKKGAIVGLFGISRDITEKQNADQRTRHIRDLMGYVIEHTRSAVAVHDRDLNYIFVSQKYLDIFGISKQDIIGKHHYEIFPALPQQLRDVHRRVLQGEVLSADEDPFENPDGTTDWHCWECRPWFETDGTVGGLIVYTEIITKRKQAEEALRFAANVFTHAREGITITDRDANILDVNAAFTNITGYSREEVLGKNPRILNSGKQDKAFYDAMWHDLLSEGHWHGEVWNRRKDGQVIAEMLTISAVQDERGEIHNYIAVFSDITSIKQHKAQLEFNAHYDALTELPNRLLLGCRLRHIMSEASRRRQRLAVAYLDLDGFKEVNDTHGHEVGDQLLATLAIRMSKVLRDSDTLGRISGDEFVAVLVNVSDIQSSVPILSRLLEAAAKPFSVGDIELNVSASVGVTFYPQPEDVDADQLLRQADQAMYQAKQAGKNRYHVFDAEHDRNVRCHHESLDHIRQALEERQFLLHYQPKVNMRTGEVIGAEALIRWQHPQRGLLPPAVFLPVIDNHPLAIKVGEWVIDTALAQIEAWREEGLTIPVSVNVGALQLQDPDFVSSLRRLLSWHPGVNPGELELEILETSALESFDKVSKVMASCQALGVGFALDDFGTGYSALTYLKQLPADLIKIDQSFVRGMLDDPDDLAILEGVLGLANAFRRQIIAEGVETMAHGEMLLRLGYEWAQGYAIARPMPAQDLQAWISTWNVPPSWKAINPISKDRLPMLSAVVEHRAWISEITDYLYGKSDIPPEMNAHQCRFGHWLDYGGRALILGEGADHPVDLLHLEIHRLAAELIALKGDAHIDDLQSRISELHILCNELLEHLKELY